MIVVGGGPAGSSAAWELARHHRECLLLDRESFPREKLCAGWITPDVLRLLDFSPEDYPHRFLTFEVLRVNLKGLRFPFRSRQYSIRRYEFDEWLLARSGVPVVRHNVRRISRDGDGYVLDGAFRCRYLIGAGGTRCPVYRELFRPAYPRERSLQVVTQELEFPCAAPGRECHLHFFARGLPGYGWVVPKARGYLNVGIGGVVEKMKGRHIRQHWQALLEDLKKTGLLKADPGEPGGYSYYLRSRSPPARLDNAFVVGDAAGLATRDMCEGIGPAVASGLMAAGAILGRERFDLSVLPAHTLTQPVARRALDFAFTGG